MEFQTSLIGFTTLAAMHCLISFAEAQHSEFYDKALAEYYKDRGTIKWRLDTKLFCESISRREQPFSFRRAYILTSSIMLERSCTKIQMELVHCEYDMVEEAEPVTYVLRRTFYANGLDGETLLVGLPKKSSCEDEAKTWTIRYQIHEGEYRLLNDDRFSLYTGEYNSVVRSEESLIEHYENVQKTFIMQIEMLNTLYTKYKHLAEYYRIDGAIKWIWNPKLFCRLRVPGGYDIHGTSIKKRRIELELAQSTAIQAEVLRCEYRMELLAGLTHESKSCFYMSGPNGEIYSVTSARSKDANGDNYESWIIHFEVHGDEYAPIAEQDSKFSGVARLFEIFRQQREGKYLYRRAWPRAWDSRL